jgi:hypothetical protein
VFTDLGDCGVSKGQHQDKHMSFIDSKRNCGIFALLLLIAVASKTTTAVHRPAWVPQPRLCGLQSNR